MIKVSVIIPCYKVEKYIETCLQSLQKQTLDGLEFIFVDDGSPDGTPAILDGIPAREPRAKIIHQANKGPGGARNTGMAAATGEYIGFMDADDTISENYYEALYSAAKRHDADIAITNMIGYHANYVKKILEIDSERVLVDKTDMFSMMDNNVVTKVIRRRFIEESALAFEEDFYGEDQRFCIRAKYAADKMVTVPDATYYYTQYTTDSITRGPRTKALNESKYRNLRWARSFYIEHGLPVPRKWRAITKWELCIGTGKLRICVLKGRDYGKYTAIRLFDLIPVWVTVND